MSDHEQVFDRVAEVVCSKPPGMSARECFLSRAESNLLCQAGKQCRLAEKSPQQLGYVLHPLDTGSFLEACPGSGKTEVVGLKAAYEMRSRPWRHSGIAVLTFTNASADVICRRVVQFAGGVRFPHFVGTIDSWLHGYVLNPFGHLVTGYSGNDGDRSVSVVPATSRADWLNAYKCKTPYVVLVRGPGGTEPGAKPRQAALSLFGNSIAYEPEGERFSMLNPFAANEERIGDDDYYKTDGCQAYIQDKSWLTFGALRKSLQACKRAFWRAGFVTHQDAEAICLLLLRGNEPLRVRLAKRFPVVMVDECQDLSWVQMEVLRLLGEHGMQVHLVGDLNQAIHAFRGVHPERVRDFIRACKLATLPLGQNFRSVQPIVNLCSRLIPAPRPVKGQPTLGTEPACVFFAYEKRHPEAVVAGFRQYLDQRGIPLDRTAVLARGHALVGRLRPAAAKAPENAAICFATGIYIWMSATGPQQIDNALDCIGRFLTAKFWKGQHTDSRHHSRPEGEPLAMQWRLFLSRVLDACIQDEGLSDLSVSWSQWAARVRASLPSVLVACSPSQVPDVQEGVWFSAVRGEASNPVEDSLAVAPTEPCPGIRITTIHQAKGETFDAVLLVSSSTRGGDGGHWSQWLDGSGGEGEHARFAYVASSRPRELLAWAVPDGDDEAVRRLEELGFHAASE